MQKLSMLLMVACFVLSYLEMSSRKSHKTERKTPVTKVELNAENWIERSEEMAKTRYNISSEKFEKCNLYNY